MRMCSRAGSPQVGEIGLTSGPDLVVRGEGDEGWDWHDGGREEADGQAQDGSGEKRG
jgi:hypothetical protein